MKIDLGDKTITIRKWKGKDKKKFMQELTKENRDEMAVMDSLVYGCIEEDVILSRDEFRYVLHKIRAYSLGDKFDITLKCKGCGESEKHELSINDVIRYDFKKIDQINVGDFSIKLGPIQNKEVYVKKVVEDDSSDLLMRVKELNGEDAFTYNDLVETFDDLDLDVLEEVVEIWEEHRFKVDDVNDITCSKCGSSSTWRFDDIPDFFPKSWFKR